MPTMLVDLASELWPVTLSNVDMPEIGFAEDVDVLQDLVSRVILYNDNVHTFDEVISQVCKAVGCSEDHAASVAWEVHTRGQSLVFEGDMFECLKVSSVLEEIALHTQVLT